MIRVLQITSKLFRGGAESFIMNVYRNIDHNRFQFDFLVFHSEREYYEEEITRFGGNVYHVPVMEGMNFLNRKKMIDDFFKSHHNYDAVHCHMEALGNECLSAAEKFGIPCRISHSHIASFEHNLRGCAKRLFGLNFGKHATLRLACSTLAGQYMYGKKSFVVLKNGIDANRFCFDEEKRALFRKENHLSEEEYVIGHVGRFELMKNHRFLIDVFSKMLSQGFSGKLVLAGDGSLRSEVERQVHSLGIDQSVVFLGVIDNMDSFYSGIDIFVMPSLFEGLPFSAIEAQCAGLPCVLANTISEECKLSSHVQYLPLDAGGQTWATEIMKIRKNRYDGISLIRSSGYDIHDVVSVLEMYYEGCK